MTPPTLPYGEWPSPITPEAVVAAAASPGEVRAVADEVFWSESRPAEGGRVQVVRWRSDGPTVDLLPDGWSARTRVHEYGGAAWLATTDWLYFVSWDDQRLHRLALGPDGRAGEPEPLTPEPAIRGGDRYADADLVGDGDFLVCVREHHDGVAEAVNDIVAIATDGTSPPRTLVRGPDFVAAPRVSPDGDQLAWIQWDHPDMPWDATELVVAPLVVDDADPVPGNAASRSARAESSPAAVLSLVAGASR